MVIHLLAAVVGVWTIGGLAQESRPGAQKPIIDEDVIYLDTPRTRTDEYRKSTVKIRVRYARATQISEALGGAVLEIGSDRTETPASTTERSYGNGAGMSLLPTGIESLLALTPDNTLVVQYSDAESLRELIQIVRALDVKPRVVEVTAVAELVFTGANGQAHRTRLESKGKTIGDRRIHLKSRIEEGAPKRIQTSDVDLFARDLGDGTISLAADWYVGIEQCSAGKTPASRANNVYRTDVVANPGQTVTVTTARVTLATGRLDVVLNLTPRVVDRGGGRVGYSPLSPTR